VSSASSAPESDPGNVWARLDLLKVLMSEHRLDEARQVLQQTVLPDKPGTALALPWLALYAIRLGDVESARRWSAEASQKIPPEKLRPDHKQALAKVFAMLGKGALASQFYEREEALEVGERNDLALIVDPGLSVKTGHHANYTLFAWKILQQLVGEGERLSPLVICRDPIEGDSDLRDLDLVPAFAFEPYAFDKFAAFHEQLGELNLWFEHDLSRLDLEGRAKLVFAHSMRALMIGGLAAWVDKIFRDTAGVAVIGLIEFDHLRQDDTIVDKYREIYRDALLRLLGNTNVRLLLYVETEFGKNFLESLNVDGLQVHVFPYLAASLCVAHAAPRPLNDNDPITFGIVGDTRRDRGVQFFPRLVASTQDLAAQCCWKLQMDRKALAAIVEVSDAACIESAFQCANASIVEGTLTSADYFALLRQIDVVILPYLDRYAVSGSGVFYESIYMGKFLLVPRGTFMPDELAKLDHPHRVLEELTSSCIEENVRWIVRNQKQIKAELRNLKTRTTRYPSEEFYDLVMRRLAEIK